MLVGDLEEVRLGQYLDGNAIDEVLRRLVQRQSTQGSCDDRPAGQEADVRVHDALGVGVAS